MRPPAAALEDQVRFDREWNALRAYAAERGVRLIGDVPIYVAPGGADHRAWPELFRRRLQAGVPPDAFTAKGQLWGNPIFDWPALHRRRYRWWVERLRRTFAMVDMTRIDHFRGFVAYWAVPRARATPRRTLERGPGARAVPGRASASSASSRHRRGPRRHHRAGRAPAPARSGFPGMVVLQFGFDDPRSRTTPRTTGAQRRLHRHARPRHGARLVGVPAGGPRADGHGAFSAPASEADDPWWSLIRLAHQSPAELAMVQLQDVLGLGSEARMNVPGTAARVVAVAAGAAAR